MAEAPLQPSKERVNVSVNEKRRLLEGAIRSGALIGIALGGVEFMGGEIGEKWDSLLGDKLGEGYEKGLSLLDDVFGNDFDQQIIDLDSTDDINSVEDIGTFDRLDYWWNHLSWVNETIFDPIFDSFEGNNSVSSTTLVTEETQNLNPKSLDELKREYADLVDNADTGLGRHQMETQRETILDEIGDKIVHDTEAIYAHRTSPDQGLTIKFENQDYYNGLLNNLRHNGGTQEMLDRFINVLGDNLVKQGKEGEINLRSWKDLDRNHVTNIDNFKEINSLEDLITVLPADSLQSMMSNPEYSLVINTVMGSQ